MSSTLRDLARSVGESVGVASDHPAPKRQHFDNLDGQSAAANNTPYADSNSIQSNGEIIQNIEFLPKSTTSTTEQKDHKLNHLTQSNGAPLFDNQHSVVVGEGYLMMQDYQLMNKLATFNRERIPERIVHARGAGAHGYFEVTNDVSQYTKAAFLSKVGLRTPVFCRFSTVRGGKESTESNRDPRGFSIKHYTSEGNYDMVGNNTPIFFIRDPSLFVDLIHAFKPNPRTGLPNLDQIFDWCSLHPDSTHQFLFLMSPRGIPAGYRFMNGYSSHTYKWINAQGEYVWVKYHYKSEQGIKNYTQVEADALQDPNFATRDLFDAIAAGQEVAWTLYVQIIPPADVAKYKWNIFDLTKVVPHSDYPLQKVGRLVLNKNQTNYFAEVEQVAFSPANLVPGIEPSPDRILQSRLFAYDDAHRYRLGSSNYNMLPINRPVCPIMNQSQDGVMQATPNGGSGPNYYPNSIVSKCPFMSGGASGLTGLTEKPFYVNGMVGRNGYPSEVIDRAHFSHDSVNAKEDSSVSGNKNDANHVAALVDQDLYEQPRMFWQNVLNEKEKNETVEAIATGMVGVRKEVQERTISWLSKVDENLGKMIQNKLKTTTLSQQPNH